MPIFNFNKPKEQSETFFFLGPIFLGVDHGTFLHSSFSNRSKKKGRKERATAVYQPGGASAPERAASTKTALNTTTSSREVDCSFVKNDFFITKLPQRYILNTDNVMGSGKFQVSKDKRQNVGKVLPRFAEIKTLLMYDLAVGTTEPEES